MDKVSKKVTSDITEYLGEKGYLDDQGQIIAEHRAYKFSVFNPQLDEGLLEYLSLTEGCLLGWVSTLIHDQSQVSSPNWDPSFLNFAEYHYQLLLARFLSQKLAENYGVVCKVEESGIKLHGTGGRKVPYEQRLFYETTGLTVTKRTLDNYVQAIRDFDRLVEGDEFASAVNNFSDIYVKEVEKFF